MNNIGDSYSLKSKGYRKEQSTIISDVAAVYLFTHF